jgi:hypothetical protein
VELVRLCFVGLVATGESGKEIKSGWKRKGGERNHMEGRMKRPPRFVFISWVGIYTLRSASRTLQVGRYLVPVFLLGITCFEAAVGERTDGYQACMQRARRVVLPVLCEAPVCSTILDASRGTRIL